MTAPEPRPRKPEAEAAAAAPDTPPAPTKRPSALRDYLPSGALRGRSTEAVTDALREAILDGVLAPSTWLREDEIAATFAVSRTPVREALRRLADEGLAVKTTHQGTVVAQLTLDDIIALYVVRENLEGLAGRLAALRCPPGLLDELEEQQAVLRRTAATGDIQLLARQNLEWHRMLRQGASNPYLTRFLEQVEHAVRRVPVSTFSKAGRAEEMLDEHDKIMAAIRDGDAAAAEAAAKEHMRRAREIRLALLIES